MKVGLVCPYSWDIPGGVQAHVHDLAEALLNIGHEVSVLAPAEDDTPVPPFVVTTGRAVPLPYNGSVARLQFGPVSGTRVRRWLRAGQFDVLHLHEPEAPNLSLLTCMLANGPIVATFHTAVIRSRSLAAARGVLQPFMEKIHGRIAVSEAARQLQVEHLGTDAIEIPNGVSVPHFANAVPLPGYPRQGGTIGFIGRYDEPRKGMEVLVDALARLAPERPDLRLVVIGRGDEAEFRNSLPPILRDRIDLLGSVSDAEKAQMLKSIDIYCAPNLGGESFGVILLEAMAAGTPIVASDLDSFRRVLRDGEGGLLFPTGDGAQLADRLATLLDHPEQCVELSAAGQGIVANYDWATIVHEVVRVYETVTAGDVSLVTATDTT